MQCYSSEYSEYKAIGSCILEKIHKKLDEDFLNNQAVEILSNHCTTWSICDPFASKVIRRMIDNDKDWNCTFLK